MFVLPARQIVALFFLIRIASGRLVFVPPNLDGSYVYIHVYISLYIYIYVCVYVCMYVCIYVYTHTYIYFMTARRRVGHEADWLRRASLHL